ncbi:MAG: GNAT family N-acetyltransferase [Armatimonadetes bacterium]|nr:GNAT family N-acetyltransferase [Candidatus Hippobium faecium]
MFGRHIKSNSVGIELRPFAKSDCPQLIKYINKPDVNKWLDIYSSYTIEDEEEWYDSLRYDRKKIIWGIFINGEIIGTATILNFNPITRNGEIGLMIGNNKYYRKGIGTETVACLCDYAFGELNCECLYYTVSEKNIPSQKIAQKNGFEQCGTTPHYFFRDGKYYSAINLYRLRDAEKTENAEETEETSEEAE